MSVLIKLFACRADSLLFGGGGCGAGGAPETSENINPICHHKTTEVCQEPLIGPHHLPKHTHSRMHGSHWREEREMAAAIELIFPNMQKD